MNWFIKLYETVFGCWHVWEPWGESLKKTLQITDETSGAKPTATRETMIQMRACTKCKALGYRTVM